MSVIRETSRSVSPIDMVGRHEQVRKRGSSANNKRYLLKLWYTHDEYGLRNRDREGEINLMFLYQSQITYCTHAGCMHGWRADSLILSLVAVLALI
jgi:hypothetical protein